MMEEQQQAVANNLDQSWQHQSSCCRTPGMTVWRIVFQGDFFVRLECHQRPRPCPITPLCHSAASAVAILRCGKTAVLLLGRLFCFFVE
jgi:hypothetical protein